MKKIIYMIIAALMAGVILTACGGGKEDSSLYGEYKLYAAEEEGMCLLASEIFEEEGSLILEKGGKGTMAVGDKVNVKWIAEGDKITLSQGGDSYTGTVKDGIITMDLEGMKMYFAKEGANTDSIGATDLAGAFDAALAAALGETEAPETEAPTTEAPTTQAAPAYDGEYKLYAVDEDGMCLFASELFDTEGYLVLEKDGKGKISLVEEADVTWTVDGEKITIMADGEPCEGTIKDGIVALSIEGMTLYFTAEGADVESLGATDLDGALNAALESAFADMNFDDLLLTDVQDKWNGWWYGGMDINGSEKGWEYLNGATYDVVMYVDLDENGEGTLSIYDPFTVLVDNGDDVNKFVDIECHADTNYLYGDSGTEFGYDIDPKNWIFVSFLDNEDKIGTGSSFTDENGNKMGYDFTFMPWGSYWEGEDSYTQFLPNFDVYKQCIDEGMESPYSEEEEENGETEASGEKDAAAAGDSVKLSINDRDIVFVYYPGDRFEYNKDYGKIKSTDGGADILFDPLLGDTNYEEYKTSFEKEYSKEADYSMEETTVNGYKTLVMTYTDWLSSGMQVVVDFGKSVDGYYGMRFSVTGDSVDICNSDTVWAVIKSMEIAK